VILGSVVFVGSEVGSFGDFSARGSFSSAFSATPTSIACMDVLGRSVMDRVTTNLLESGVGSISLICESGLGCRARIPDGPAIDRSFFAGSTQFFNLVEKKVNDQINLGASVVLLLGLDAYLEFEFGDVLEFHRDRGQVVTRLRDADGPLHFWLIDGARARKASLSCASVLQGRSASRLQYRLRGYSNRLRTPHHLRQLVRDSFASRCRLKPAGTQVKPGVWIDEGASVQRAARLVAPAYIGKNTRVETGALITRGSHIEANCTVSAGTVIDDASVFSNTYLGPGLEISHAVVERHRLMHLRRNVAVDVGDPTLIGATQAVSYGHTFSVDPADLLLAARQGDEQFVAQQRAS
jgi:hypothetical protein